MAIGSLYDTNEEKLLTQKGIEEIASRKTPIGEHAFVCQETYKPSEERFVNLYWLEIPKDTYSFALVNDSKPDSLLNITEEFLKQTSTNILGSINTCNLYLMDEDRIPKVCAHNLFVNKGQVLQLPSNNRASLIEHGGQLSIKHLKAEGELTIGGLILKWIGAKSNRKSKIKYDHRAVVYGTSDIRFRHDKSIRRVRTAVEQTTVVKCAEDRILLGIDRNNRGQVSVVHKGTDTVSLFNFLYVLEVENQLKEQILVGDIISGVSIDDYVVEKGDNAVTLGFSLPKEKKFLETTIAMEVVPNQGGIIMPLERKFFKAWSLVLTTTEKVVLFLVDAFPFNAQQEGLNVYELHDLLTQKFDFCQAVVCDAGQSSKLCVNDDTKGINILGNLHYIDFTGTKPEWDGIHGRKIPSALIAYQ